MSRWLLRSTAPTALLIAFGLIALMAAFVIPAGTVETRTSESAIAGVPQAPQTVTVEHNGYPLAITLLVIAVAAFAGAITLTVLRRRRNRRG